MIHNTYITGSNMLRIFRHGVKLFGGEFLRSNGNAVMHSKPNVEYKEQAHYSHKQVAG